MSEANSSENNTNSSNANNPTSWYSDWDSFFNTPANNPTPPAEPPAAEAKPTDAAQDWQTVNFPNAISADAIERQSMYSQNANQGANTPASTTNTDQWATRTIPPNSASASAWAENLQMTESQPDIAQLIALIQELNQCNNALLDRVSQLEEALETTQMVLKEERERSHSLTGANSQDMVEARQQISSLFNELEQSHQTNQRQQMLVEALTEQFTLSQERVAQLERECTAAQQQCTEQAQMLTQSEYSCRDLRVRLQRQQRYTMQFKAALERCLEAPNLPHEAQTSGPSTPVIALSDALPTFATSPLVPKVRHIRPWSAEAGGAMPSKLDAMVGQPPVEPIAEIVAAEVQPTAAEQPEVVTLELTQINPFTAALDALAPQLSKSSELENGEFTSGDLEDISLPNEVELPLDADDEAAERLLQNLARLVEISTEDVVKASLADDFSTFAQPAATADESSSSATSIPALSQGARSEQRLPATLRKLVEMPFETAQPLSYSLSSQAAGQVEEAQLAQQEASAESGDRFIAGSNFPAPVVYPLRPQKKIASLAAVDLPTFPR